MLIAAILRSKGTEVVSVAPDATVAFLLTELARHGIGAAVVVEDGRVVGIVSERDVVRGLDRSGPELLSAPVSTIMTGDVFTCTTEDTVEDVGEAMTLRRFRHVPVVDGGRLAGIVSIGDVVKSRLSVLEDDRAALEAYIQGRRA
ncbi:CBS domain-containing protein [Nocardiopsis sp. FIRDI 009]|uniref:CBS domain-containing protein n=1 Tax=Nocardiopsis sp. FIRDI 009 TaxID=714197 RepID=UPI000E21C71D|nr:CBS domain-containing protein [Nocardiopsis sp. FIRDI 009]